MVFGRKLVEVLERGDAARRLLDLVKDDERVCQRYGLAAKKLYLGDDALGVEVSIEQQARARLEHKVETNDVSIMLTREFVKKPSLSCLAGTPKQEGFAIRSRFPSDKFTHKLSLHIASQLSWLV